MALQTVFPWTRHLQAAELREFTTDLVHAAREAAQHGTDASLRRVLAEWRATAAVLADAALTEQLTAPLPDEDHGKVPVP